MRLPIFQLNNIFSPIPISICCFSIYCSTFHAKIRTYITLTFLTMITSYFFNKSFGLNCQIITLILSTINVLLITVISRNNIKIYLIKHKILASICPETIAVSDLSQIILNSTNLPSSIDSNKLFVSVKCAHGT